MKTYEKIHEPIEVDVYFGSKLKNFKIFKFYWKNHEYNVDKINMMNVVNKGKSLVYLFSVSNQHSAYQLRFDTAGWQWWIEEVLWGD